MKAIIAIIAIAAVAAAINLEGAYSLRLDPDQERTVVPPMIYIGIAEAFGDCGASVGVGIRNGDEPGDIPGLTAAIGLSMNATRETIIAIRIADLPLANVRSASYITVGFITRL